MRGYFGKTLMLSLVATGVLVACGAEDPSAGDTPEEDAVAEPELDWELDDELDSADLACPPDNPECDGLEAACTFEEEEEGDGSGAPGSELMGVTDPKTSTGKYRAWPGGRIPYAFARDSKGNILLDATTREKLSKVMTAWETLTEGRVRFRQKSSTDTAYVEILTGKTLVRPFVGYRANRVQELYLKKGEVGPVIRHELGHVLGLHHEQRRSDRLKHIQVKSQNIVDSKHCRYQFSACSDCERLGSYDIASVMQYRSKRDLSACRIDGKPVLLKLDGSLIDHDWKISVKDLNSVALLYSGSCSPESNAQFCSRHAKNCGTFGGTDNCGNARTASCGSCTSPQTCGGGGTANVCGGGTSSTSDPIPESGSLSVAGICADVAGGSTADGAKLLTWSCHGSGNQDFRVTKYRQLKVSHSLKCASVIGASVPGALVEQATCSSTAARQQWKFQNMEIVNGKNGKCLYVPSSGYFSGQSVMFGSCTGSANQKFNYRPDTEELKAGGYCLTPRGGAATGNDVILRPCDGRLSQRWFQSRGGFVNRANTGQCLRVEGGPTSGTVAEVAECNDALGQRWALRGDIRDARSGLCLKGSSSSGVQLALDTCNASKAQKWTFWSR
jgi:hypothetical protein